MLRAYKYRIYPTTGQKVLFSKTFGCYRFVYNWALSLKITTYKKREETLGNVYLTNLMKSELKTGHEWLPEVNSQSLQSALRDLDTAYTNFFRDTKAVGFPRFKSRKSNQSFQCPQYCRVDFERRTITIPKAKESERSWTLHDRDFNAACNIKEYGLKALHTERGEVKPANCPLVDNRPRILKSNGRKKREKRGGISISEAAKFLV